MTKLEIACVIVGMIGVLAFQPTTTTWKITNGDKSDFMLIVWKIFQIAMFLSMVILPLYFRLWRR